MWCGGEGRTEPARQPDAGWPERADEGAKDAAGAVAGRGPVNQAPEGGKAAAPVRGGGFEREETADERVIRRRL